MKHKYKIYFLLLILGIMIIWLLIPIDDYSSGMAHGIGFIILAILLLLVYIVSTITNSVRILKRREKFDFVPTILIGFIVMITAFIFDSGKFWTERVLMLDIDDANKSGSLTLYKNGTFEATVKNPDFGYTYQGDYKLIEGTIHLLRDDLTIVTDSLFTTVYKRISESEFEAGHTNFKSLYLVETCSM